MFDLDFDSLEKIPKIHEIILKTISNPFSKNSAGATLHNSLLLFSTFVPQLNNLI